MNRIDHVAITVDDVRESVDWYVNEHGCSIIYCDDTWAMLQFENIKLALVVDDEHPFHIAFEVKDPGIESTLHRDGSISRYIKDPSGNSIELIKYPQETKHFSDGFLEGRWEDDIYTHDGDGKPYIKDIHGTEYDPKKMNDGQNDFFESDDLIG